MLGLNRACWTALQCLLVPLGSVLSLQRPFVTPEDQTPFQKDVGSLLPLGPELGQARHGQLASWIPECLFPKSGYFPLGLLPSLWDTCFHFWRFQPKRRTRVQDTLPSAFVLVALQPPQGRGCLPLSGTLRSSSESLN